MAARPFPMDVKTGSLSAVAYPQVTIDRTDYRLAPGARIFDDFNNMILPTMAPQSGKVNYQLDSRGDVIQLWFLTAEEAAQAAQPKP